MSLRKKVTRNFAFLVTTAMLASAVVAVVASVVFEPFAESATAASGGATSIDTSYVASDPSQIDALADGKVTKAELDAQKDRMVACTEASGATIVGLRWEGYRNVPTWNYIVKETPSTSGALTPYDECWVAFYRDVQATWAGQHEPSDAKKAADERAALACVAEERLGVSTMKDLGALRSSGGSSNGRGVERCLVIGLFGYDLKENPPIRAD